MLRVLNAFFASVFNSKTSCSLGTKPPELEDRDREWHCFGFGQTQDRHEPPVIQGEMVTDLLHHLDIHKSMGPDGMHPSILRELSGTEYCSPSHFQSFISSPG